MRNYFFFFLSGAAWLMETILSVLFPSLKILFHVQHKRTHTQKKNLALNPSIHFSYFLSYL